MALNASVAVGLAFMFSCFNMKPAAATILALSVLFVSMVLENIPFFEPYQEWFPTYHFHTWIRIYAQPTPWDAVAETLCVLLAMNLTTFPRRCRRLPGPRHQVLSPRSLPAPEAPGPASSRSGNLGRYCAPSGEPLRIPSEISPNPLHTTLDPGVEVLWRGSGEDTEGLARESMARRRNHP